MLSCVLCSICYFVLRGVRFTMYRRSAGGLVSASCGWITSPLRVSGDVIHPQLRPLGLVPRLLEATVSNTGTVIATPILCVMHFIGVWSHAVQLSQVVYSIEVSFVLFKRYLVSSFQLCERVSMLHVTSINFVFCFAHVV